MATNTQIFPPKCFAKKISKPVNISSDIRRKRFVNQLEIKLYVIGHIFNLFLANSFTLFTLSYPNNPFQALDRQETTQRKPVSRKKRNKTDREERVGWTSEHYQWHHLSQSWINLRACNVKIDLIRKWSSPFDRDKIVPWIQPLNIINRGIVIPISILNQ